MAPGMPTGVPAGCPWGADVGVRVGVDLSAGVVVVVSVEASVVSSVGLRVGVRVGVSVGVTAGVPAGADQSLVRPRERAVLIWSAIVPASNRPRTEGVPWVFPPWRRVAPSFIPLFEVKEGWVIPAAVLPVPPSSCLPASVPGKAPE